MRDGSIRITECNYDPNKRMKRIFIIKTLITLASLGALMFAPLLKPNASDLANPPPPSNLDQRIKPYSSRPSKDALTWADKEVRKMSLDEKIGQLICAAVNATFLNQDSEAFKALRHQVVDNHVGGIILFRGPVYESVVLVNRMQQLAKHPLLISADLEAGSGMRFDDTVNFPWNMAIAATGNPEYARREGERYSTDLRAGRRRQQQCCEPGDQCAFLWRRSCRRGQVCRSFY